MSDMNQLPADALEQTIDALEFTTRAQDLFFDTVDHPNFASEDQDLIYHMLLGKVQPVRFGDYLKRYIYMKAEMTGAYTDIPAKEYLDIICAEFSDRNAPCSFAPTKATLRNLAKNWLEQLTVSRKVVLLLGFGLGMSAEDVDAFLLKGLKEAQLNSKDPMEVICWYCYAHGYGFAKYEMLWEQYINQQTDDQELLDDTLSLHRKLMHVHTDQQLMKYLSGLYMYEGSAHQSVAARRQFDLLYAKTCAIVAELTNQTAADTARMNAARMEEALERNARLGDDQKVALVRRERENYHVIRATDVGPGDVEQTLYAAIPRDKHGNMLPMKASALQKQFDGKRLTRQHIGNILTGKEPITRYDLLTLHFFVFTHELEQYGNVNARYSAFERTANQILLNSGMGEYYVVNPYECFLLMCIISQDPLGTFSDVWELSYQQTDDR